MARVKARDSVAVMTEFLLASSTIVGVTVFSALARVTRRARLAVPQGLTRLALPGLPEGINPGALAVRSSRGTVRFVETDRVPLQETVATESEANLANLERQLYRLTGQLEALRHELALIDKVGPLRPEQFLQGLDALMQRRRETLHAARVHEYQLSLAKDALDAARRKKAAAGTSAAEPKTQSMLVVGLESEASGDAEVELTYPAGWASWRPNYHLRLSGNKTIEVVKLVDVWQETGEDWEDVALRLSTSEPEAGLHVPQLLPWYLESKRSFDDRVRELYQSRPKGQPAPLAAKPAAAPEMSRKRSVAPPAAAMMMDREESDESLATPTSDAAEGLPDFDEYRSQFEDEGVYAEVTSAGLVGMRALGGGAEGGGGYGMGRPAPPRGGGGGFGPPEDHPELHGLIGQPLPSDASGGIDFELEVPGTHSVASSRQHHRFSAGSIVYPAKIEYLLRPAIKDHAFGRVTVTHAEDNPLLAGPASIFVADAFFGKTRLETTPARGKLELDLGAETAIKCARRSHTTVRTAGLINKDDIHVVEVIIEVENYLREVAELEIQDQVPVSADSKIKVKLLKTDPKDASLDDSTGILTFKVKVAPGGRLVVGLTYELEAPKDYRFTQMLGG